MSKERYVAAAAIAVFILVLTLVVIVEIRYHPGDFIVVSRGEYVVPYQVLDYQPPLVVLRSLNPHLKGDRKIVQNLKALTYTEVSNAFIRDYYPEHSEFIIYRDEEVPYLTWRTQSGQDSPH